MTKIERFLVIYDGNTEEVSELIPLPDAELKVLKDLLDVPPSDPDMHDRYAIGPDEIDTILTFAKKQIDCDFSKNAYFVEAIKV